MATRKQDKDQTDSERSGKQSAAGRAPASGRAKKPTNSDEIVKSAKTAARKAVKSVAKVVTEAVEEVKKVTKAKAPAIKAKAASAASKAKEKVAAKVADRPAAKSRTNKTATAAMAPGTTTDDVRSIRDLNVSSDFRPEEEIRDQAPTDIREHYFEDQNDRQFPPIPETPELPDHYDDTRITVLVRDPEWVYAYWEVNEQTRNELNLQPNGHDRRLVVRMYKITDRNWPEESAHYFFDVDVSPYSASWYIHLPETNQRWCAELGYFNEEQAYIAVCRSNELVSPRNTISEETDSEWMIVEESFEKIYSLAGGGLLARLHGTNGNGTLVGSSSEGILRQIHKQVTGTLQGLDSTMSSQMFSESAQPVSTKPAKDFFLEVRTELVLYGATVPGSTVTVQGNPVILNSDGTFSLRFALPEGQQVLDVHAVNADGDMEREITPVVKRTTRS